MLPPSTRPSAKLFHVLVAGGLAMATPACASSDPSTPSKNNVDGGGAQDGASSDGSSDATHADTGAQDDANADADALAAADACLNTPGDCTHGICAW